MKKRIAGPIVACINVIEPLEDRRLFAVSLAATALLAPQPNAFVASSPTSGTGTGGGIITPTPIPPAPTNDTTVPVTIHAAAGTPFSGSVGRLKNVTIATNLRLDAFISWGDGAVSQELADTYNVRFENCDFTREGTRALVDAIAGGQGISAVEPEALATSGPVVENDPYKSSQGHLPFIRRDQGCSARRSRITGCRGEPSGNSAFIHGPSSVTSAS